MTVFGIGNSSKLLQAAFAYNRMFVREEKTVKMGLIEPEGALRLAIF